MASFLSQLGGLVSPGLTVATQAVGAQKQGEIAGRQIAHKSFLDDLKAQRDLSAAKDESALKQAQAFAAQHPHAARGEAVWNPSTNQYEVPSPYTEPTPRIDPLSPEGIQATIGRDRQLKAMPEPTKTTTTRTLTVRPHVAPKADAMGLPPLGGGGGAPVNDQAAWAAQNPPNPGETREQYKARYAASVGNP